MKNFHFLALLISATLCSTLFAKAQPPKKSNHLYKTELQKSTWATGPIVGMDTAITQYTLTKITEQWYSGNLLEFRDSVNFSSQYVAECGNDYFTTLVGKYRFFDKDKLGILVDSISYSGQWNKPTEHRKPKLLFFVISKTGNSLILTKIK